MGVVNSPIQTLWMTFVQFLQSRANLSCDGRGSVTTNLSCRAVEHGFISSMFCDDDQVGRGFKPGVISECISYAPLDSVSNHRVSDFLADGDAEPGIRPLVF